MSRKWVCLVGASVSGIDAIRKYFDDCVVLCDQKGSIDQSVIALASEIYPTTFSVESLCQLINQLVTRYGEPQFIISFTELGLEAVAIVNEKLGIFGNSLESVIATRNKGIMRKILSESDELAIHYALDEAIEGFVTTNLGASKATIIKPVAGSGSEKISLIRSEDDFVQWQQKESGSHSWIAEEFIQGDEFSVECFTHNGVHQILGVTEKVICKKSFVEIGHQFPAQLKSDDMAQISDIVSKMLDVLGIKFGPTHTEIRMHPTRGPCIIETHTRPGGDRIPDLVRIVSGWDLYQMTIASLVGLKPEVTFGKSEANASAIRFMTANAGRLVGVQFPQHICDRTKIYSVDLYKTLGELCGELTDSRSRTAAVLTIGSSNENAIATAEEFKANTIFTILEA